MNVLCISLKPVDLSQFINCLDKNIDNYFYHETKTIDLIEKGGDPKLISA